MNKNRGFAPVLWVLVAILLISTAFAQETTGGIQGTVKDPQGLTVSKAVVEVTGASLIGTKKIETDGSGYYRFANLPPGAYTIVVTAPGFRSLKQTGLILEVGKLPTIDLKLEVGTIEQTVEVSSEAPIVDVTQSKVQTNVTSDVIVGIPKGRSFQSVIQFAPGARNEPLQKDRATGIAGYQIDGASGSENSFLMEGQETSDIRTGQTKTNAPFEFIQEVQIKTSGFEAEYGGALGGVVNVIQKRGGNAWHGSIFSHYEGDIFDSAPAKTLRFVPGGKSLTKTPFDVKNTGTPAAPIWVADPCTLAADNCRKSSPMEFIQGKKDHYRIVEPGFEVGGYLLKDRIWAFVGSRPSFYNYKRTVNWKNPVATRSFYQNEQIYYSQARLDALVTSKIRVFGAWQFAQDNLNGSLLPNRDNVGGQANSSATSSVDNFNTGIGTVSPNVIYNTGADITLTPNLIATTRFGRTYADQQDRGKVTGTRIQYLDSNYISGATYQQNVTGIGATSLTGTLITDPINGYAAGAQPASFANIGNNSQQLFDKYKRKSFAQDLSYFKRGFLGTHNLKVGFAWNSLMNDTIQGVNSSLAFVAYGKEYTTMGSNSACTGIIATNLTRYGVAGGTAGACQGLWGTINFHESGTIGAASSTNQALYAQDAWTLGKGVTLNIGVRMDKENVPSFKAGNPGIEFGFGDKIAPRFGGSWDVMQNGKLKIYGSFGYFFDIMKYELPRGSFGGDYWHDCVYAMDDPNWSTFVPVRGSNGHFCNPTGGANFAGAAPAGLRFIENKDFRTYSNDPTNNLVDPRLKPMQQHEIVFGADYALTPMIGLETRYSRKRLDHTIEDAGLLTPAGEQFYIVNPGEGINIQPIDTLNCASCPVQPKAKRNYDALEVRLTKRASEKWFGSVSYTYSKLVGNYSGLSSTDTADSTNGRSSPNVERAFDEPWMQFDSHGRRIDGPLATDRPNTFKAYGWYHLKLFKNHETLIGGTQQWYQGTPLTTFFDSNGANQYPEGRGVFVPATRDAATGNIVFGAPVKLRTPMFGQFDLNIVQEFHISKTNEALKLGFEANIDNVFNQHAILNTNTNLLAVGSINPLTGMTPVCRASYDAPDSSDPAYNPLCAGVDYKSLLTGFDWKAQVNNMNRANALNAGDPNANPSTTVLNSQYGQANFFQTPRTMRFKVKFTF
jgi:hypothetical protein